MTIIYFCTLHSLDKLDLTKVSMATTCQLVYRSSPNKQNYSINTKIIQPLLPLFGDRTYETLSNLF